MPYSIHWTDRLGDSQSFDDVSLEYAFSRAVLLQREFAFRNHRPATILDADGEVVAELDAARTMLNVRHPHHGMAHNAFCEAQDRVDRQMKTVRFTAIETDRDACATREQFRIHVHQADGLQISLGECYRESGMDEWACDTAIEAVLGEASPHGYKHPRPFQNALRTAFDGLLPLPVPEDGFPGWR